MNKFKKLIVAALSLVMALALAVPTFADDATAKAKLKAYLASYGVDASAVVDALTPEQVQEIKNNQANLEAKVANTVAAVKANPAEAQRIVNDAVATVGVSGVSVSGLSVNVSGDKVTANATVSVNGAAVPSGAAVPVSTNVTENVANNVTSDSSNASVSNGSSSNAAAATVAANPLTHSGASVIKATGDNSAVVVVAAVLAVVAVLGLGFRKNNSMTVA